MGSAIASPTERVSNTTHDVTTKCKEQTQKNTFFNVHDILLIVTVYIVKIGSLDLIGEVSMRLFENDCVVFADFIRYSISADSEYAINKSINAYD